MCTVYVSLRSHISIYFQVGQNTGAQDHTTITMFTIESNRNWGYDCIVQSQEISDLYQQLSTVNQYGDLIAIDTVVYHLVAHSF